jgi:hypothetical protein
MNLGIKLPTNEVYGHTFKLRQNKLRKQDMRSIRQKFRSKHYVNELPDRKCTNLVIFKLHAPSLSNKTMTSPPYIVLASEDDQALGIKHAYLG